MAFEKVVSGSFTATLAHDANDIPKYKGQLVLGFLGNEWVFDCDFQTEEDISLDPFGEKNDQNRKLKETEFLYSHYNRYTNIHTPALTSSLLPVYLRFEPEHEKPLQDANNQVYASGDFNKQYVIVKNAKLELKGRSFRRDNDGDDEPMNDHAITYGLPFRTETKVRLSVLQGCKVYLASLSQFSLERDIND